MAELPLKENVTSHPICLRVLGPSVYQDDQQRTWLNLVVDTGDQRVRLRQEDIPIGHIALTTHPLASSTMPFMWMLYAGGQYVDSMCRFWRIVHHIKEDGVEEMILELIENS